MASRSISLLGSTGSVGANTLKIVSQYPDRYRVVGLAGGDNIELLADQVRAYRPKVVSTRTVTGLKKLKEFLSDVKDTEFTFGEEGAVVVATLSEADTVMSSIVGAAGLVPTLAAIKKGKKIGLANKESMVVAGPLVRNEARKSGSPILPVDSEHSAIFQCLGTTKLNQVRRLILTASGGPFFQKRDIDLSTVTKEQALAHPNWKMGEKITIDSATMMNKGLEIIEARWLFDLPPEKIDVIVHPQSIVHSMVEFIDCSILAQLSVPDMCGPIAYALSYPERLPQVMAPLKLSTLSFFEPDHTRFPAISIAQQALAAGETFPAVLNASNEMTVQAFLDGNLRFIDICEISREILNKYQQRSATTLEDYLEADRWARTQASDMISSRRTSK